MGQGGGNSETQVPFSRWYVPGHTGPVEDSHWLVATLYCDNPGHLGGSSLRQILPSNLRFPGHCGPSTLTQTFPCRIVPFSQTEDSWKTQPVPSLTVPTGQQRLLPLESTWGMMSARVMDLAGDG